MKYYNTCRVCNSDDVITHGAILSPFLTYRIFNIIPTCVSKLYDMENGINYFPCLTIGCKKCNFIGCNILFDDDEMIKYYKNYMKEDYIIERRLFDPSFNISNIKRVCITKTEDWILYYLSSAPKTVLDFGACENTHTPFKNIADITLVDIGQCITDNKTFDLLSCLHVLEHVPDIQKTLDTIFTFTFKYAYFEVPHESFLKKYSTLEEQVDNKEFWHEHINFFNLNNFSRLFNDKAVVVASHTNNTIIQLLLKKN